MRRIFQSVSIRACAFGTAVLLGTASAQTYYPDDPIWKEPPPRDIGEIKTQKLHALVDFYKNTVYRKGERNSPARIYPSQGVNTVDELPDSVWYTNRHSRTHRLSADELRTGPNRTGPPDQSQPWTIISAKAEGVTPGFTIKDARGRDYFLKFDPPSNPEMATAADVICAKILYAAGYNVPENYIVYFTPEQLQIKPGLKFEDPFGRFRAMQPHDVTGLLKLVASDGRGRIRAVASLRIAGKSVGQFKYYKRRADDPNELAPHEHLRVLRGLYVFAAWLNQTDAKALNTFDTVVEENGRRFITHYLLDFGSALGSDALYAKDPRLGHEYLIEPRSGLRNLASLGLYVPAYARVRFPDISAAGNFSEQAFDPEKWKPNYPNAAFANRLPGDEHWGARRVMAFTNADIRCIVETAEFSNPRAIEIVTSTLIARRDRVGRVLLEKLLPADGFRIEDGRLRFDDLGALYGFRAPLTFDVQWSEFDNMRGTLRPMLVTGIELPREAASAPP
ncbi:MAG TPA: hypothetical protein VFL57_01295, partial [Bryobacteraceae bacterium]|nr:hypothetical protein [Bryobacteraceae bacterium]